MVTPHAGAEKQRHRNPFLQHMRALLWREVLLVRHHKIFALLQLLVSGVLVAAAAILMSPIPFKPLWTSPPRKAIYDVSCYYSYIGALPANYSTFASVDVAYALNISTTIFPNYHQYFDIFVGAFGYMSSGEALSTVPPYVTHIEPDATLEGCADMFIGSYAYINEGSAMCVAPLFPASFDAAVFSQLQPKTKIAIQAASPRLSLLPVFVTAACMAAILAQLPALTAVAGRLTDDKASRLREHLKIMGMRDAAYYGAMYAAMLLRLLPPCVGGAAAMAAVAPDILSPGRAGAFFAVALLGGLVIGFWLLPIALVLRKPVVTSAVASAAVFFSAAMPVGVFHPAVPEAVRLPLLFFCGAPAGVSAALVGLAMPGLDLSVGPHAAVGMAVASGCLCGLVAEYIRALWPGDYGVPKRWYFPIRAVANVCRRHRRAASPTFTELDLTADSGARGGGAATNSGGPLLAVDVQGLWKQFGSAPPAVRGLDLDVRYGEILALLGHNGAGKSTTVSVLTGMLSATRSERCKVGGRDVALDIDGVREVIGVCPQVDILMPDLSAEEHVLFFGALRGVDNRERGLELLRDLGLPTDGKRAGAYSGGMQRRLSLALALCTDSPVLFLDEPSSGLDPVHRRLVWDLLRRERDRGRGIILTTHFMEEAEYLGDRIAIMAKGRRRCCDTSAGLKHKYGVGDFVQLFPHVTSSATTAGCDVDTVRSVPCPGTLSTAAHPHGVDVAAVQRLFASHFPNVTVSAPRPGTGVVTVTVPRHDEPQCTTDQDLPPEPHKPQCPDREEGGLTSTEKFARILLAIEADGAGASAASLFGVQSCAVSQTSIEDVFLRIADGEVTFDDDDKEPDADHSAEETARREETIASDTPQHESFGLEARLLGSMEQHHREGDVRDDPAHIAAAAPADLSRFVLPDGTTAGERLFHAPCTSLAASLRLLMAVCRLRGRLLMRHGALLPVLLPLLVAAAALASFTSHHDKQIVYYDATAESTSSRATSQRPFITASTSRSYPLHALQHPLRPTPDRPHRHSSDTVEEGNHTANSTTSVSDLLRHAASGRSARMSVLAAVTAEVAAPTCADPFLSPIANIYQYTGQLGLVYHPQAAPRSLTETFAQRTHYCLQTSVQTGFVVPPFAVVSADDAERGHYPIVRGTILNEGRAPSAIMLDALQVVVGDSANSFIRLRLAPSSDGDNGAYDDPFSMLVPLCLMRAFSTMVTDLPPARSALPITFGRLGPAPGPPPPPYQYPYILVRIYITLPYTILGGAIGLAAAAAAMPVLADIVARGAYAKMRLHGLPSGHLWRGFLLMDAAAVLPAVVVYVVAPYAMDIPEYSGTTISIAAAAVLIASCVFNSLLAPVVVLALPRHLSRVMVTGAFASLSLVLTASVEIPWIVAPTAGRQVMSMLNAASALKTLLRDWGDLPITGIACGVACVVLSIALLAGRLAMEPVWASFWTRRITGKQSHSGKAAEEDVDVAAERSAVAGWRAEGHPQQPHATDHPPQRMAAALVGAWRVFTRPRHEAVRGVSVGVRLGECFGLLGPNGAGKSTAVGLLTAQDTATGGEVCVGDERGAIAHTYAPASERLASQEAYHAALPMGLCPQHDTLFPALTAEEHLEFYLALRASGPWVAADWASYIQTALHRVGLENVIGTGKRAETYSGGMKRKLQVAIAMYTGGRLCVLDEPSTGMDPGARRFLWAAIHSALEGGERSVLLTTHSMEEAENACTRLAIMQHGELRCIGTPEHLRARFGDGYTLTVAFPAAMAAKPSELAVVTRAVEAAIAALRDGAGNTHGATHDAVNHPIDTVDVSGLATGINMGRADDDEEEHRPSTEGDPKEAAGRRPLEVLGGCVYVYKLGRLASLGRAYAAFGPVQRAFPTASIAIAQNATLEQIFIAMVREGPVV